MTLVLVFAQSHFINCMFCFWRIWTPLFFCVVSYCVVVPLPLSLSPRRRSDLPARCVQGRRPAGDHDVRVLRPQRCAGVLRRRHRRRLHLEGGAAAENRQSARRTRVRHVLARQGEETSVCVSTTREALLHTS